MRSTEVTGLTKTVLLVSSMMTVMAGAIISPSLPGLQEHFSATPGIDILVPLVLTIVALSIIVFSPVAGYLSDRVGRRRVFLFSLLLYALGGTAGLYLNSIWLLIASRAVLGVGVAGIATCTLALAGDYFEGHERARFIALITAFMSIGGVVFNIFGGLLADMGWRYPYLLYAIPLVILPAAYLSVHDRQAERSTHTEESGRAREGVRWQTVALIYGLVFLGMAIFYIMPTQLPFYLRSVGIGSAVLAGSALAMLNLAQVGTTLWYRSAGHRIQRRYLITLFFLLAGIAFLALSMTTGYLGIIIAIVIFGAGFGFLLPLCNAWITAVAPDASRGRLVGGLNTALYAGQFLSPILAYPAISAFGYAAPFGLYAEVGAVCLLICLAGAGGYILFRRREGAGENAHKAPEI